MSPNQPHQRDAGLRRVSRTTAWLSAGAVALVGVFTAYVGHALPGTRSTSPASVVTPTVPTQAPVSATPGGAVAVPTAPPATSPPRVVVPVQPHTRTRGS
jgi:hypothetical protein